MARRPNQDNFGPIRSKNFTDIGQTVHGIHIPGRRVSVSAITPTSIGYQKFCRVITGASATSMAFGDSDIGSTAIACVADVAGSLDGTYFILEDDAGSVAFWIDVDDSGTAEPAHGADRSVEITTVTTGMTAAQVGTAVYTKIIADAKFSAGSDDLAGNIVVAHDGFSTMEQVSAGTSGFTFTFDKMAETIKFPPNHMYYVYTSDDYVYTDQACIFEIINV